MYNLRKKIEAGHRQGQNEKPVSLLRMWDKKVCAYLIILLAKWVYRLVLYNESKHNILAFVGKANKLGKK
jgi:hypothetical protein